MVVVVVRRDRDLDPLDAVVAPERVERPEQRAPRRALGARHEAGRDVVAGVDEERRPRLREQRVAVGEARSVAQEVRRDRHPRPPPHVLEVPRRLAPDVQELLHPSDARTERPRRLVDRVAVRGQQPVGLALGEDAAGDDGRRLALDAAVRPLCRRERPHLAVAVDQVAAERDARAVDIDEVRDRAGCVTRRRQRVDLEGAVALRAVLLDDTRRPAPARGARTGPRAGRSRSRAGAGASSSSTSGDQLELDRRHPDARAGCDSAIEPLHLVAVMVRDEHVGQPLDAELLEVVEHETAAEVDRDRVGFPRLARRRCRCP